MKKKMFVYTRMHALVSIHFVLSFCFSINVATSNSGLSELLHRVLHLDPSIDIYFHKIPFQENPAKTNGVENNGICDPVLTFLSCVSSFSVFSPCYRSQIFAFSEALHRYCTIILFHSFR